MMKKIIAVVFMLIFISGCTNQNLPQETIITNTPGIDSNIEVIENDPEVMGTYILYYDGEKGSSGIIVVLGPSSELTMLIPKVNNVLQSYEGTYTAVDGILSFAMLEIPTSPSGWFGHRNFEYEFDGENILLTHTDKSNDRNEKSYFSLNYVDTLKMVEAK